MYFDAQYNSFALLNDDDEALSRTLEVLLFKGSTSSKFDRVSDKLDDFWASQFINSVTAQQINGENFILALSQYVRSNSVDEDTLIKLLELSQEGVISAVRQSGIIARPDHHSWNVLQTISGQLEFSKLAQFLHTAAYIQLQSQQRLNNYQVLKHKLQLD